MKTLPIAIVMILFFSITLTSYDYHVYAPIMPESTEQLYNESAIIVVGNIVSAHEIQNGTKTEYVIQPQEYLKPANFEDATKPIVAQGIGSKTHRLIYNPVYEVGDRVLFFLQKKDDNYVISLYSIFTKSNCNGKQLLALNFSPGDFSVTQENNTYEKMFTGIPVNITAYVHNNPDLKSRYVNVNFIVHTPRSDLVLTEKRHVHIDACKGFASSSWSFVPMISGRYGVGVTSYDENGVGYGGGSFCCIKMVGRNYSSSESNMSQSLEDNLGLTGPPRSSLSSSNVDNNSWLSVIGLGGIIGGVAVAISIYVMRFKK
ncbi:MAG: hypothetical protein PXX83_09405 [Candidatus Nitrosotalea sp.]|nr:hypothetical protein [Candidatus Nitrosotalea sp.]